MHSRSVDAEWAVVREAAEEVLTPRQQRILQMSCEGWSVHEMAAELQLSSDRVSDEKYKAVRKLRRPPSHGRELIRPKPPLSVFWRAAGVSRLMR